MQGTQKQIEWANKILATAQTQADELVATAKRRVADGSMPETHAYRTDLVVRSLMQDLRALPKASDLIDRYGRTPVRLEPIVNQCLTNWSEDAEQGLVAKLSVRS